MDYLEAVIKGPRRIQKGWARTQFFTSLFRLSSTGFPPLDPVPGPPSSPRVSPGSPRPRAQKGLGTPFGPALVGRLRGSHQVTFFPVTRKNPAWNQGILARDQGKYPRKGFPGLPVTPIPSRPCPRLTFTGIRVQGKDPPSQDVSPGHCHRGGGQCCLSRPRSMN